MASEIRVNKITHTAGVGTVTTILMVLSSLVYAPQKVLVVLSQEMVQILQEFLVQRFMVSLELEAICR